MLTFLCHASISAFYRRFSREALSRARIDVNHPPSRARAIYGRGFIYKKQFFRSGKRGNSQSRARLEGARGIYLINGYNGSYLCASFFAEHGKRGKRKEMYDVNSTREEVFD